MRGVDFGAGLAGAGFGAALGAAGLALGRETGFGFAPLGGDAGFGLAVPLFTGCGLDPLLVEGFGLEAFGEADCPFGIGASRRSGLPVLRGAVLVYPRPRGVTRSGFST